MELKSDAVAQFPVRVIRPEWVANPTGTHNFPEADFWLANNFRFARHSGTVREVTEDGVADL